MRAYRPRRPLCKLTFCLACATLASCELPHAIAADRPFTPVLAADRPPVVMVLTAPIPLPRWVQAAAAAPSTPHFTAAEALTATRAAPVAPPVPPVVAAAEVPRIEPLKASPDAGREPRIAPSPKPVGDPVIQIATPTYFDRPPPTVVPATSAVPSLPASKSIAVVVVPPKEPATQPSVTVNQSIPKATAPAVSSATAALPASNPTPLASGAELPGLPVSPVNPTVVTQTTTITTTEIPASAATETPAASVEPLADPIPVKPAPSPEAVATETPVPVPEAVPATAAPAPTAIAQAPEPSPSLQISDGRFAGMPLPNLPALAPEPDPSASGAAAPGLQTALNDAPPTERPFTAPPAAGADTATARSELRRASERTGLTPLQLARIEESRRLIADGNAPLALSLMQALNAELDNAAIMYVVKAGDDLWHIAEQPQVYGNAYLWPLIWRANTQLKQPSDVQPGMKLRVPLNPAVLDVTDAIDYARRAGGEKMQPVSETSATSGRP